MVLENDWFLLSMFVFSGFYYNANRVVTYKYLKEEMKSKDKKRGKKKQDYNIGA